MNKQLLFQLQQEINQILYDDIVDQYKLLAVKCGEQTAAHLIISAVATNLGVILAQSPDSEQYFDIAVKIVTESLAQATKNFSKTDWGQIGHA